MGSASAGFLRTEGKSSGDSRLYFKGLEGVTSDDLVLLAVLLDLLAVFGCGGVFNIRRKTSSRR